MRNLRFKFVGRRDRIQGIYRLFRIAWERGEIGFGAGGYSTKVSLALAPKLFAWRRQYSSIEIVICCLRLHYCRAYGGIYG